MLGLSRLIGQGEAVAHLSRLMASGRLPHALLFVGPSSTGKATAARALAAALFCADPSVAPHEACGLCAACAKMAGHSHGDYHEVIVDKRTIPVAAIREASHALAMRAVEGGAKFLLVPDAERMNASAQNALLKTLEEPPGRTHIVLTTSRLRSILPTVVSRCQRVDFAPLPTDDLARVVEQRRALPPDQARMVATLAQGSLGVALELDYEALIERRDRIATIDAALEGRTAQSALAALEHAVELAHDRKELLETLDLFLVWLHDQVLLAAAAPLDGLANLDRREQLEDLAARRGLSRVLARAEDVMEAKRQLEAPFNWNAQMIAEQLCLSLAGHGKLERLPIRA